MGHTAQSTEGPETSNAIRQEEIRRNRVHETKNRLTTSSLPRAIPISAVCVARLTGIPIFFSGGSVSGQILTETHQAVRITDRRFLADLNIVTHPQPFSRRFLGTIRSLTVSICNQGTQIETLQPPSIELPKHEDCGREE